MDKETLDIKHQLKLIGELVGHEGWSVVERSLKESIDMIQNLEDLDVKTPEQVFLELRARKIAVTIISGWLEYVKGTAEVANQELPNETTSYIITKE